MVAMAENLLRFDLVCCISFLIRRDLHRLPDKGISLKAFVTFVGPPFEQMAEE
jgi:hypothetical protein